MRTAFFSIAAAMLTASPVFATDFPVPRYSEGSTYQRELHTYERVYREPAPRVVVAPAPVVTEVVPAPVIVQRPVIVVRPPLVIEEPVYAAPRIYAYGYPVRRFGPWGYHRPRYGW
jgi:hypothetical protein